MNQEDPRPGVVIDVEPETDAAGTRGNDGGVAGGTADTRQPAHRSSRSGALAMLLPLLAIGVLGYLAYQYASGLGTDLATMNARIDEADSHRQQLRASVGAATDALNTQREVLEEQHAVLARQREAMDEARSTFEDQQRQLARESVQLQEREADLRAAVADVHRRVGSSGTQWIITETEYLIRIANHRLILARDTGTARMALELADQRLSDTKDPGWTGVREQIARDIARLSTFEAPDLADMSATLSALIDRIPQLKVAQATNSAEPAPPEAEAEARRPDDRGWGTLADDVWAGLRDSIRIRERDVPLKAMLAPEQQFFLYENLKLHLETSRLALARGEQRMYRDSLQIAIDWIGRHFVADDGAAAISGSLSRMMETDIEPAMPDIGQSLRALRARMQLMKEIRSDGDRSE